MNEIKVLDKGFIKYIDHLGSDMRVANAARISFAKQKESFDDKDEKLIKYLSDNDHTSPFRHCFVTFHVKAPIFVFRQWQRYRVASEFNEVSGRYVEFDPTEYYLPEFLRYQSKNNKQGSGKILEIVKNETFLKVYKSSCEISVEKYNKLLEAGVAKEMARCVLPVAMYSEVYWTASLQTISHFVKQRTDSHAQWEIQQYAIAIKNMAMELFPVSMKYLLEQEEGTVKGKDADRVQDINVKEKDLT